ncbi:ATP-binding protein [Streptomyces sp. NPDC087317]|uniref:ATP-binding protein n=1 Tax=Streptomyces sp. NPDC087317 TaxID=3365784 RepID=UPI003808AE7A
MRRETWMATVTDGQSRSPDDPGPARGARTSAAVRTQDAAFGPMTASGGRRPGPLPAPADAGHRPAVPASADAGHRSAVAAGTAGAGSDDPFRIRSTVPADPSWAAAVRRLVAGQLARLPLSADQRDGAVLATDELFANAVKHARTDPDDTVTVTVEGSAHALRVTVADSSPVLPRPRPADATAESGRGLAIVAALADDWGMSPPEPGRPGKRVWFTLRHQGSPSP